MYFKMVILEDMKQIWPESFISRIVNGDVKYIIVFITISFLIIVNIKP